MLLEKKKHFDSLNIVNINIFICWFHQPDLCSLAFAVTPMNLMIESQGVAVVSVFIADKVDAEA